MKSFAFKKIDAFASATSSGNPEAGRVVFGGGAIVRIEGRYRLHD